jgi:ubiquinone/menaquinone biosynthesis C-methylase UbiE
MTEEQSGHKWFAAFWEWAVKNENAALRRGRQETVGGARGRVLEVGCGTGANFPYYGDAVSELIATDPDPYMLERASKRAAEVGRPITIRRAPAEQLPFENESLDTVVSTWVMCHARDPAGALSEVKRVLKPEGELRFFEHVRYDHAFGAFWQDLLTPIWRRMLGSGCHLNRDTARSIMEAGFVFQELQSLKPVPLLSPMVLTRPNIMGIARPA